jgi:hypothetical protein
MTSVLEPELQTMNFKMLIHEHRKTSKKLKKTVDTRVNILFDMVTC